MEQKVVIFKEDDGFLGEGSNLPGYRPDRDTRNYRPSALPPLESGEPDDVFRSYNNMPNARRKVHRWVRTQA